jgi:hypothetical protein
LLRSAEVDFAAPDPGHVWDVFKQFVRIPVEGAEDGVLYQTGLYGFGKPPTFQIGLVRQFSFFEGGEYDRMEQLQCDLHFQPDEDLRALAAFNTWADHYPSLHAFFRLVESRPEWPLVRMRTAMPLELSGKGLNPWCGGEELNLHDLAVTSS